MQRGVNLFGIGLIVLSIILAIVAVKGTYRGVASRFSSTGSNYTSGNGSGSSSGADQQSNTSNSSNSNTANSSDVSVPSGIGPETPISQTDAGSFTYD